MPAPRIDACLVAGGKYHDIDFARLELLRLLAENPAIRVRVAEDFRDRDALLAADFLITYTCDVVPSEAEQDTLAECLERGKRWFALHGTNSILKFLSFKPLKIGTPRLAPRFMEMLGSQFLAHPPIGRIHVEVSDPEHPLVRGIEPFDTEDEPYLMAYHGDPHALLHFRFDGRTAEFETEDWSNSDRHLVFYINRYGAGEVLYLTLGHCRGHYDMQPLMDYWPSVERCSWERPEFYELLRRGIRWAARDEA